MHHIQNRRNVSLFIKMLAVIMCGWVLGTIATVESPEAAHLYVISSELSYTTKRVRENSSTIYDAMNKIRSNEEQIQLNSSEIKELRERIEQMGDPQTTKGQ